MRGIPTYYTSPIYDSQTCYQGQYIFSRCKNTLKINTKNS